jgi:hypothetical protein
MIGTLNDIEYNQQELQKCNKFLEDEWTDSSADQFKSTYLGPIEAAGTTFIGESFGHAQQLQHKIAELDELYKKFKNLCEELDDICQHPSWEGCGIGTVEGHTPITHYHEQKFFVITKDEMPYLNDKGTMEWLAYRRVTGLDDMENAHFYASAY